MKKLAAFFFALSLTIPAHAQNAITLPYAAQTVADIGNGPVKVRVTQGNASIFTSQGSGVGSTSGSSTALTLTATPTVPPIVGAVISGAGITSGTTVAAYNGTTGVTLSAAMTVVASTPVAWGAACPGSSAGIPAHFIQASVSADYYLLYTQARVCAISPGGPTNTLLILPIFYDGTTPGGGGGGGGGSVLDVFSRTGHVVAAVGDYSFSLISGQWSLAQSVQYNADSFLANVTSGPAQPTIYSFPACANDGAHAWTYTSGVGIVCTTLTGGGGTVLDVFGRTGHVVATTGDYSFGQISGTVSTTQGGVGRDAHLDLANTISVSNGIGGTVSTALFTLLNAVCSSSATRPVCVLFFGYADPAWWGAVGDGSHDDTTAIISAVNYMGTTGPGFGGIVKFGPLHYLITTTLTITHPVILAGSGQELTIITTGGVDFNVIFFGSGSSSSSLRDMWVLGSQSTSGSGRGVIVDNNLQINFQNCTIWASMYALRTTGVDGYMSNCYLTVFNTAGSLVLSGGANWYERNKFDTSGAAASAFTQQAYFTSGVAENHFTDTDFSGNYTNSINIDDGGSGSAITIIEGGVASAPVSIANSRYTSFIGMELSGNVVSNGPISVVGSYGFGGITVSGAGTRSCAGNIAITC